TRNDGIARSELLAAQQREADLSRQLDAHHARFSSSSAHLARPQGERRDAQMEIEALERVVADAVERLNLERARIAELEALVPALDAGEASEAHADRRR